jgi:hypothetical protein
MCLKEESAEFQNVTLGAYLELIARLLRLLGAPLQRLHYVEWGCTHRESVRASLAHWKE